LICGSRVTATIQLLSGHTVDST